MNLKPQDLRLGILIHDTVRNTNTTLKLKHFMELAISEEQFFGRYKPVAITDQMLLDFGFEKDGEYWYDPIESDDYQFVPGGFARALRHDKDATTYYVGHSKFIHQLQTLFHSLTGEELNVDNFLLHKPK